MDKEKVLNTLKQATEKGLEVGKQTIHKVKDTTKTIAKEEKEKYHDNRKNGVDNFDDKIKKWSQDYGFSATIAKSKMNKKLKQYQKEQELEAGISQGNFIIRKLRSYLIGLWQATGEIYGIKGYLVYIILAILAAAGVFLTTLYLIARMLILSPETVVLLVISALTVKYISTNLKYSSNAIFYDFKWYLDLMKEENKYRAETAENTFHQIPLLFFNIDNELEEYLEERGRKGMKSGKFEKASIANSRIEYDEHYGWIRIFEIDNTFFKKSVESLEDVELTDYFIIPQATSKHKLNREIYYAVHGEVKQSIDGLIMSAVDTESFIEKIVTDNQINYGFKEIEEQLEQQKQNEIDEEKARKERIEIEQLEARIFMKNMSKESVSIIKSIQKNKENWSFNLWDVGKNMEGNNKYFRVRCQLLGNATISTITSLIPTLEREFRKSVIIKQLPSDRKSFELTVILSENLPDISITTKEMYEKYNKKGEILIGDSYTGWQSYKFSIKNLQAYWTSGGPGAGKSWTNLFLLKNLIQLRNIDDVIPKIEEFYIVSDSKVSDYRFLQDKAFIASGPENVLSLLNYLIEKCEEREKIFMEKGVTDILEYNKKIGYMSPFVFVEDEYENSVLTNMKNFSKDYAKDEINQASAKLHRIMRSAGGISITSTQSAILDNIKDVGRYVNIKFFGRNNYSDVRSAASAKLADKFNELGQNGDKVQGLVGFQSKENLLKNAVFLDKAGTAMIKVPILQGKVNGIEDILETKNFEQEILQKNILDEANQEEEIGVDLF